MFYSGSLQEGISSAVDQQKLVLCFVTNENDESQTWENDYLKESSLKELIQTQAVALRLMAGSEEAGYLSQIFPLPKTPTVVIMKHGELKEYIAAGTSKDEFFRRVQSAFNVAPQAAPSSPSSSAQPASVQAVAASFPQTAPAQAQGPGASAAAGRSEIVSRVLAERAAKLKAQTEEAERKAKEERVRAQEKAKADSEAGANTDAARLHKQAEELKRKRQKESEERNRILKRIEDDKAERRLRASKREQQRIDNQTVGDVAASMENAPSTKLPSTSRISETASLQVRLFDGSTIRSRFKTASPLKDVRTWVDESRGENNTPCMFKQVLTPLLTKSIDETEESKTLGELGLAPSSTLVLVPVQKYVPAYEEGSQNRIPRLIGVIMGFFTWLLSLVGLASGSEASREATSGGANNGDASSASSASSAQDRNRRVRGFQNPSDRPRDHQLYNGNSLNFEPRPDDEDE